MAITSDSRRWRRGVPCIGIFAAASLLGCTSFIDGVRSHEPPEGSESAARLAPGPHDVSSYDLRFVDESRPTAENGDFAGSPSRTLEVTVWSPEGANGRRPLVVYAHGFSGHRREMEYLLEHLASHGYVVAALEFPLTNGDAPGGPTPRDLAPQPGDVRFVIDSLLALDPVAYRVRRRIDTERIALAGLSYGGLTTTLTSFHPRERDPRLDAAISIAGPTQMFAPHFFANGGPPFLMVAGTRDGLVPFPGNAEPVPEKVPGGSLVSFEAGTHLGFVEFARRWMRFSHDPDATACAAILDDVESGDAEDPFAPEAGPDPFAALEGEGEGVDFGAWEMPCTDASSDPARAMRPQRQHHLTVLAIRAFLDAELATNAEKRAEARRYLREVLAAELPDARFVGPAAAR